MSAWTKGDMTKAEKQRDSMWRDIENTIKNTNRLTREDIVNGKIVQLCYDLEFLASIYDDKTSDILTYARKLICSMVNAECMLKIFESEDIVRKYFETKKISKQLSKRESRCCKIEYKIKNKIAELKMLESTNKKEEATDERVD